MSQYRVGKINSTTALIASGVSIPLGFVPDRFRIVNYTKTVAGSGVGESSWINGVVPNGKALLTTYTAGAPVVTLDSGTAGITPIQTGGSWYNTVYTITTITNASPGVVTISGLTPTGGQALTNGMTVTISGVSGMPSINTQRFIVSNLTIVGGGPTYTFTLYDTFGNPFSTVGLGTYVSGGQLDMISYPPIAPVLNTTNGQVITPGQPAGNQYDLGYAGVTLGADVLGSNGDVLWYEAFYSTPTGW